MATTTDHARRGRSAPLRPTVDELLGLHRAARRSWNQGRRPWLGLLLGANSAVVYTLLRIHATAPAIRSASYVRAELPLSSELTRLPLSMFVPTPDLPLWLAIAQLVVVVGLAELLLDRRLVVAVGLIGHALPTLAARFMIELGPGHFLGLPTALASSLDTGPSALTTAVGMWLLVRHDARRIAVGLAAALLIADQFSPGLDGREHLLALTVGLVAGCVGRGRVPRQVTAPALRLRRAGAVLFLTVAGLLAWGSYQPVVAAAPINDPRGVRVVRLVTRTQIPVLFTRVPPGDWLSRAPTCLPSQRVRRWLWQTPLYLCLGPNTTTTPVVDIQIAGISQTQRLTHL